MEKITHDIVTHKPLTFSDLNTFVGGAAANPYDRCCRRISTNVQTSSNEL
jgi:hypothetical protein